MEHTKLEIHVDERIKRSLSDAIAGIMSKMEGWEGGEGGLASLAGATTVTTLTMDKMKDAIEEVPFDWAAIPMLREIPGTWLTEPFSFKEAEVRPAIYGSW